MEPCLVDSSNCEFRVQVVIRLAYFAVEDVELYYSFEVTQTPKP